MSKKQWKEPEMNAIDIKDTEKLPLWLESILDFNHDGKVDGKDFTAAADEVGKFFGFGGSNQPSFPEDLLS